MQTSTPPLAHRYLFKLIANICSVPVYLLMEALLPRALGPAMYGNFSFATNLFQQFLGFLDMGTSTCLYNALSRRARELGLLAFYARVSLAIFFATVLLAALLCNEKAGAFFMPAIPLWLAPLAALWAYLTWLGRVLRSINDALGQTISSEIARTIISLFALLLLVLLYYTETLNIHTLFGQQYLLLCTTACAFIFVTQRALRLQNQTLSLALNKVELGNYVREFFTYSHPLCLQALLSFLMLTAERWLLQWFNGSTEQGFFALSQKVSMACFLFVSAMTPLIMRELSIAWGNKDTTAMGQLLTRYAPLLYAIAAYFSCFTLAEGAALVDLFGGAQFQAALLPVQIMALYPLHQAYGQLAGSVFHATGKTHVLRNMTALECVYGSIITWFLLAPHELFGLSLGATGLAIKTVVVQIITVNGYLFLASRFLPIHFWSNLLHQILCMLTFTLVALCIRSTTLLLSSDALAFSRFFLSGVLYTIAIACLCTLCPRLLGLTHRELMELRRRFLRRKS